MKQKIINLVNLSQKIGSHLDYVQGGGGNISVKISQNLMAIKASGYELKNVTESDGFAFVDRDQINKSISILSAEGCCDEQKFSTAVKSAIKLLEGYSALRPSMETGFHSLLPFVYVLHSHSVYANILTCSKEGEKIAEKLFADKFSILWIEYKNPGWQITKAISLALKNNQKPQIIFLQNHGLIVAAEDEKQIYDLHEMVNRKIISFLKVSNFESDVVQNFDNDFIKLNVLFPDQIVFGISEEFAQSEVAKHIFMAYCYILRGIEKSGLKPVFISKENIDFVANMESEKYRKEVARK